MKSNTMENHQQKTRSENQPVCVITGASSGIGEALAVEYGKRAFAVALLARRMDRLADLKSRLDRDGVQAEVFMCDVNDEAQVHEIFSKIKNHFGRIDVVIANAGIGGGPGSVERLSNERFERVFKTNIYGVLNTYRACLPALRETCGRFAVLGSIMSYISLGGSAPYAMSKFAVRALADAIRLEIASSGVSVTLVAPGFVKSEIRHKNSKQEYDPSVKDSIPSWLVVDTPVAARDIFRAVKARRSEVVVTFHGKVLFWMKRFFPFLIDLVASKMSQKMNSKRTAKAGA